MINSTMQSTKSGGPLAAAWAVTRFIGDEGYAGLARQVRDGHGSLVAEIAGIDHLRVLGAARLEPAGGGHRRSARRLHPGRRAADPRLVRPAPAALRPVPGHPASLAERGDRAAAARIRRCAGRGGEVGASPLVRSSRPGVARSDRRDRPRRLDEPGFDQLLAAAGLLGTRRSGAARTGWPRSTPCSTPPRPVCARRCWSVSSTSSAGLSARRRPRRRPASPVGHVGRVGFADADGGVGGALARLTLVLGGRIGVDRLLDEVRRSDLGGGRSRPGCCWSSPAPRRRPRWVAHLNRLPVGDRTA